ncbi:class I SAM-dependent methyltransferase [Campylobacter sp. 19-13652]|uniref:class I SAM-dependent methyltransferase n=1 Tax=Campylobacter sp. 19-13652 TaxID=2840180 RepID=UPI001C782F6D|nr:class I SAM-dependent methyltransferase [Campylobacter sp. 19-13652]BCX78848.1 SAM-dependent methyltransferase [Campylobacter sp. 19-13652]
MSEPLSLWDKKAANYARFSPNMSDFEAKFYEALDEFGVSFLDKSVLDVGCGSGVYSLRIASSAQEIDCVDGSYAMLEILNEDAQKLGLKNVKTYFNLWDDFMLKKPYDIAFCTMSPALDDKPSFDKFIKSAKNHVYLGWASPRSSDVLEPFFKKYGKKQDKKPAAIRFQEYLKSLDINPKSKLLSEERVAVRSFSQMCENICWHLEISKLEFSHDEVAFELENRYGKGLISEKISSLMLLLVF